MVPLVEEAVEEARVASSQQAISDANPEVKRVAHLRRLAGTKRWMVLADGLVERASRFPDGFSVESTDADHNQGKYAFRSPLGICTVKREPHNEEEGQGKYIQEAIEGVLEQAALSPDIDPFAAVKAYISVPPEGAVRLIATHPTLAEPMIILIDEIDLGEGTGPVATINPSQPMPGPAVSSALGEDAAAEDESP
jgi:hypothetical protein